MTFSIVARCPDTGALGVAVASAVPAVGALCPYVRPGVGAVSTQSWVNPLLAIKALDLLGDGYPVDDALATVVRHDTQAHLRQLGIVTATGASAAWTGEQCTGHAGQRTGSGYAIQGNMLVGQETLAAMEASFLHSAGLAVGQRLMQALEAGQDAGGDKRGRQSASLTVYRNEAYPSLDLRVDDHADPVSELRRVFGVAALQLVPFIEAMPTANDPARALPPEVSAMLLLPPSQRPGAPPPQTPHATSAALLQEISGTAFGRDRFNANLKAFQTILAEIRKLRELDLADVHPAVIFDPTAPWRRSTP